MTPFEKVANENDKKRLKYTCSQEFAFEFVNGSKILTATIPKNQNYFRRILEQYKNEGVEGIELKHDGEDAQVWSFPVKYLKIKKPRKITEEEKAVLRERLMTARAKNINKEEEIL